MSAASKILQRQFRQVQADPTCGFSAGLVDNDVFKWRVTLIGPTKTPYEGGVFPAVLEFPHDFPNSPPKMRFLCPMYHPNIRHTGEVCISILHPPGDDVFEYEHRSERWLPVQTAETILLSVVSMLSDPNCDSPENVDAARTWRLDQREYIKKVRRTVEQALDFC
jgi:ubiquitin-conjugating enzyme E2 G1